MINHYLLISTQRTETKTEILHHPDASQPHNTGARPRIDAASRWTAAPMIDEGKKKEKTRAMQASRHTTARTSLPC